MRNLAVGALFAVALAMSACETYDHDGPRRGHGGYGGYDYVGGDYDRQGNDCGAFGGPGGDRLDPWLACTDEGQDLVRRMFAHGRNAIGEDDADRANIWFRRHADTDRDMCLTDAEIKGALVNHARHAGLPR
jgi:opacity protein-like surface antigen